MMPYLDPKTLNYVAAAKVGNSKRPNYVPCSIKVLTRQS